MKITRAQLRKLANEGWRAEGDTYVRYESKTCCAVGAYGLLAGMGKCDRWGVYRYLLPKVPGGTLQQLSLADFESPPEKPGKQASIDWWYDRLSAAGLTHRRKKKE